MIERLIGHCVLKHLTGVVLDVNGVGYGLDMSEGALAAIAIGDGPVTVWVHTHVREDALRLYGFMTFEERTLFTILLSLSGVGPKLAMAVLSRLTTAQLVEAVDKDDSDVLEEVPGIGPRQSKKILLELKPKVERLKATGAFVAVAADGSGGLGFDGTVARDSSLPVFGAIKKPKTLDKAMVQDLQSALENFGYKEKELAPLLRQYERKPPAFALTELIRLALAELTGARRAETATKSDARPIEELF